MDSIEVFEENAAEYDEWYDENPAAYISEIQALRSLIPSSGTGLEVGAGTGRFAAPLGIKIGVEPAQAMAKRARARGIEVIYALAEALPFRDESFDFVLMVTTVCFLDDPLLACQEAKRTLVPGGSLIIGMIDRDSPAGRDYDRKKTTSKFYKFARFRSADEVMSWLKDLDFYDILTRQTIFKNSKTGAVDAEPFTEGHGRGAFLALSARKRDRPQK
ncbi:MULTISPECIES: class I SAM-dependent methyltransferase [Methanothrix]|jgi:SAM-dependent methyltransferase|uniref:Methyltransferase, putative n=1 Tax=Methanothrix soehngenii (strain ATCC 5969 / DSM 3671 / JCM 10134 / NBRC 103675 / OCM 69 / GP-6) TaxID=990316 RepID=F4BXS2_METSG|nr:MULTISPECIES: class I SAM-dependent methyltransferase [Methanothrix]NYT08696.1 class I SAM-dependent methyltransferase [Methanosarcinales archaeon]AEB67506.1 methyltransferase, putative [Methanothrix soehngenii GP6]MBP7067035.1 class I SAM-dependent methyltransferase [Methanothrix sp.]MDY0410732.1 class I SAM-dependent methyltransferase [Methanothrix soehngenii]UEC41171.1 MAG: putative Methyltransferase [Methanothrix sp.]